jgi:hypothetical protein
MPRYFFHVIDGIETIDSEGTVLENVEEARAEAIVLSGDAARQRRQVLEQRPVAAAPR